MMRLKRKPAAAAVFMAFSLLFAGAGHAHFIWLVPQEHGQPEKVQIYFGEDASPDDPDLLQRLTGMEVRQLRRGAEPVTLPLTLADDALTAAAKPGASSLFVAAHDLGVFDRGDAVFRLKYYAKGGPPISDAAWTQVDSASLLRLDVVPTLEGDQLQVRVRFDGRPVAGAEVTASGPGLGEFTGATDAKGIAQFTLADPGLYSIRARHIEDAAGEIDGKPYPATRHYSTVAVRLAKPSSQDVGRRMLPPLPEPVTSFGAAVCDGYLYTYGGHTGDAHSYSIEEQGHQLRRVPLAGGQWETVAEGPRLQGLALVAHGDKLYRIGGFTAKNRQGEEHDLWSQDSVARFDPATASWKDLPPLPEPRSSHDAAVLDDGIYVVGGWAMAEGEHDWHDTAWKLDLSADQPSWQPLPAPPFQRRALALAAHDGKLYAIGGMQQDGGATRRTDVFDPASGQWSRGPDLASTDSEEPAESGEDAANSDGDNGRSSGGMTGFGASAFATGGRLYVTTIDGSLQRLSEDGSAWEVIGQTPTARFFHRLLPVDDQHLLVVGGANMRIGKFDEIEILDVAAQEEK